MVTSNQISTSTSPRPPNPYIFWKLMIIAIQKWIRNTNTKTKTDTKTMTDRDKLRRHSVGVARRAKALWTDEGLYLSGIGEQPWARGKSQSDSGRALKPRQWEGYWLTNQRETKSKPEPYWVESQPYSAKLKQTKPWKGYEVRSQDWASRTNKVE